MTTAVTTHQTTPLATPHARRALRPADELRELAERGAARLAPLDDLRSTYAARLAAAEAVAEWAGRTFPGTLAVACSMADAVLPHLVAQAITQLEAQETKQPRVDVLFLDTGYHFSDTLVTRDLVAEDLDVTVVDVRPTQSVAEQDAEHGARLYERDPALCCRLRKVEPLAAQLATYEAWVTGVRRDEAPTRAGTPLVVWDEAHGLVKVNPLAGWTFDDLLTYAREHDVIVNPLVAAGYPSIGCEPCTRPVAPGDDPRSGRWAGFAKTECGIHT